MFKDSFTNTQCTHHELIICFVLNDPFVSILFFETKDTLSTRADT